MQRINVYTSRDHKNLGYVILMEGIFPVRTVKDGKIARMLADPKGSNLTYQPIKDQEELEIINEKIRDSKQLAFKNTIPIQI